MWRKVMQTGKAAASGPRANRQKKKKRERRGVILRKSRKDLLDFYIAESISPKVD